MKKFENFFINEALSDDELDTILLNTLNKYKQGLSKKYWFYKDDISKPGPSGNVIDNSISGWRMLGFMEGIMISLGILTVGEKFDFEEYRYKILYVIPMKEREMYPKFIVRKVTEYLKEKGMI